MTDCGKKVYAKKEAETQRNYRQRKGNGKSLRIYHCPMCNGWHLTHQVKGRS